MGKRPIRKYTPEFKAQALDLASRIGWSRAARQLGVNVGNLHHWKTKKAKPETKAKDELNQSEEILRLRKENEELKKINYILKRAAAVFSQDQLK